jgi:putative flippase GtrA
LPARFVLAGVVGFLVDAGVLYVLMRWLGVAALLGRVASFLCAAFVTWRINRSFTFRSRTSGRGSLWEWLNYLWASAFGAMTNYGTFALLILTAPLVASIPTLGVAAGSVAGMLVNFVLYNEVVFPRRKGASGG